MASMKVKHKKPPTGNYQPQVVIQGKVYYYISALEVEENETPKFAALYVYDPELEGAARRNNLYLPANTPARERQVCEEILIEIQDELHEHNLYVQDFQQICQIPDEELEDASFVITEKERPANAGTRTYNANNLSEVSVMMPEAIGSRDIVVRKRGGGIREIKDTHRSADPLHFVLLHSKGMFIPSLITVFLSYIPIIT